MTFDQSDLQSVALCAVKEARSDGLQACVCVMWVIANRAWDWQESVHNVVYGKNQFTSMSLTSDPEFNWEPRTTGDWDIYNACLALAPSILMRTGTDPTQGAHYYGNLKEVTSGWFERQIVSDPTNHPLRLTEGKQSFFA
jgi:hypothetical protein